MAYLTPDLPYAYSALEPYIDEKTMKIHHDKHHAGYTLKLNAALKGTEFERRPIEDLLKNLSSLPDDVRTAVRNNGGGHYNHGLFWDNMSPRGGGEPQGRLAQAVTSDLGGFDGFVDQFSQAAAGRFGSGWAWLASDSQGSLSVLSTPNQDNPLSEGLTPLLGLDVWEHAYYLLYQKRRPEYIENFFHVIDWNEVQKRYEAVL